MTVKTPTIPKSLQTALENGDVIPFIGAGVSASIKSVDPTNTNKYNALFPGWGEFLRKAVVKLNDEGKGSKADIIEALLDDDETDYLDVAERAKKALQTKLFNELLDESFNNKESLADPGTLELPQLVWKLGSDLVITTNFDDVLEWNSINPTRIRDLNTQTHEFAETIRQDPATPTLFYLHGKINDKANIVLTKPEFKDFYDLDKNQAKLDAFRTLLARKTILFIGYSLDDEYSLRQLEYIDQVYGGAASSYYALMHVKDKGKQPRLSFIDRIYFEDFGAPLLETVRKMSLMAQGKKKVPSLIPPPPPPKHSAHFNVPYSKKGSKFVGREKELTEIYEILKTAGCAAIGQAVNIKAIGGVGKTQLAVEFAYRYKNEYPNGVFWINADADIGIELLQLATSLNWINDTIPPGEHLNISKAEFLKLKDCLIIFDNVNALEDIKDYYHEPVNNKSILITSREPQKGFRQIDLALLDPDKARELLLITSGRTNLTAKDNEYIEKILNELGGLALAIELVGGYLSQHDNISFEKYYGFFNEYPLNKLEALFENDSFTKHDTSILKTLKINEKLLAEKPLLVNTLHILAWSGASSMGISLLQSLLGDEDELGLTNELGYGCKLNLLKHDAENDRYEIHRLLARCLRYDFPLENNQDWHKEIASKLEDWFEERALDFAKLSEFESEIIHLETWQEQTLQSLTKNSIYLTRLRGNVPRHRGLYQESFDWFKKALDLYEENKLDDKDLLGNLSAYIGEAFDNLGNPQEALKYEEKAIEIRKELFGDKHPSTAISYNNIGSTYRELGNYQEALKYVEKALEIRKEFFGDKHPYTANSYNNVGTTYGELGNYQEALKYKEKALEIRKELLGDKHPNTANSYNNVGYTYGALGDKEKQIEYQEKAFAIYLEIFGNKHPHTILVGNNLIMVLKETMNNKRAMEIEKKLK